MSVCRPSRSHRVRSPSLTEQRSDGSAVLEDPLREDTVPGRVQVEPVDAHRFEEVAVRRRRAGGDWCGRTRRRDPAASASRRWFSDVERRALGIAAAAPGGSRSGPSALPGSASGGRPRRPRHGRGSPSEGGRSPAKVVAARVEDDPGGHGAAESSGRRRSRSSTAFSSASPRLTRRSGMRRAESGRSSTSR